MQRREIGDLLERVLREGATYETPLTLVAKYGSEMPGQLTVAPIISDASAHGAQAIWSPIAGHYEDQRAA